MHTYLRLPSIAALGILALSGAAHASSPEPVTVVFGPEYSANKGLFVPEETRQSIGLKIVDVDEQQLAATFDFSLFVYSGDGERLLASGRVPAAHAQSVSTGQTITVRDPGSDRAAWPARITRVEPAASKTGTTEIVAEFPRIEGIAAGAFLRATLTEGAPVMSASVPRSALLRATDGYFVYATSGDHFVRTLVTVGALSQDRAVIKEGLYAGDRVVAEPVMSLWLTELAAIKGGHSCCAVTEGGK